MAKQPLYSPSSFSRALAKLLAMRDERLSITVVVMKLPADTKISSYTKVPPHPRVNFLYLPQNKSTSSELIGAKNRALLFPESQTGLVRDAVAEMMEKRGSTDRLAGFVLNMFCTPMIDVANEVRAPSYIFFPSGAASLGLMLHLQSLNDDHDGKMEEYEDPDAEVCVPGYVNPVPAKVWPAKIFDKGTGFIEFVRRYRESAKGLLSTPSSNWSPMPCW